MSKLSNLISDLENKIPYSEKSNPEVSKSDVAWQLDHSLKVINGIIYQLKNSNAEDYKLNFNFKRLVVFTLNKMPRGKGKAPKSVQSFDKISKDDLLNQLNISKKLILDLENLPKNSNFKHPYFGVLSRNQTIKFLNIHTYHHLKIIEDILK